MPQRSGNQAPTPRFMPFPVFRYSFLLLFFLLAACGTEERHPALPAGATVLVLGDSLSYGTGASRGEDYPSLMADMTGWNVINAGVPGDTTADGLERLPGLLETHQPRLVVVELGGNDLLRHLPEAQVHTNLQAILAAIRARDIPAVVLAAPRPSAFGAAMGRLADAPLYGGLGEGEGGSVIPDILSEVLSDAALKADPIHPNAAGYRQVAVKLYEALLERGFVQ